MSWVGRVPGVDLGLQRLSQRFRLNLSTIFTLIENSIITYDHTL